MVKAFSRLERLDVLVNNAGVDYTLPIEELSTNQFDHVLAVNLRAPFVLAKHAARLMRSFTPPAALRAERSPSPSPRAPPAPAATRVRAGSSRR